MKFLLIIVLAVVILGGGYYWFVSAQQSGQAESERLSTSQEPSGESETKTARGTVAEVDREAIAYDGPAYVMINLEEGGTATIAVPSMGLNLCAAQENILDVYTLEEGARVEVRGTVGEEGHIVPCQSADHYLRLAQ